MGANSQTPFLWGAGASNNGLLQAALTVMSTELNSLAVAGGIVSSVGGASGAFTNANTGQAIQGDLVFVSGGAFTPTAASFSVWFLKSKDGGASFDTNAGSVQPGRGPDATFAPYVGANATGWQTWSIGAHQLIIPAYPFKVYFLNGCGVALPASGNTLLLVSPTIDY